MPIYEYFCRKCGATFELLRPMARSEEPAPCPRGHAGARRTLSVFAAVGRGGEAPYMGAADSGGGCGCGGACACGGH
ncbi:MAG: zinc ribbon domain-containing protein [Dehalococcoidia bacterium]